MTHAAQHAHIQSKAAAAARRCAPTGTACGVATGRHRSTAARWMAGSRNSVFYRALVLVNELARGKDTTPRPFIDALNAELMRTRMEEQTSNTLIKRWHELRDREPMEDAREEVESRGRNRAAYRAALRQEASTQCELAEIDEVLEARGINPADFRGDGVPLMKN